MSPWSLWLSNVRAGLPVSDVVDFELAPSAFSSFQIHCPGEEFLCFTTTPRYCSAEEEHQKTKPVTKWQLPQMVQTTLKLLRRQEGKADQGDTSQSSDFLTNSKQSPNPFFCLTKHQVELKNRWYIWCAKRKLSLKHKVWDGSTEMSRGGAVMTCTDCQFVRGSASGWTSKLASGRLFWLHQWGGMVYHGGWDQSLSGGS